MVLDISHNPWIWPILRGLFWPELNVSSGGNRGLRDRPLTTQSGHSNVKYGAIRRYLVPLSPTSHQKYIHIRTRRVDTWRSGLEHCFNQSTKARYQERIFRDRVAPESDH
jgi:hypothetical protein